MDNMAADNAAGKRINSLLDAGSFVEIGGAVTARTTDFNMQEKETPADGVITGYGVIDGNLVYVYSQDATVLNGAIGEMHAKKISNIYDMAMKMGAPVIGLVDCAGFRLQEATDALEAFGKLYQKQSMASGVIPQITAIFGTCGGGMAVIPSLTDFTFMETKNGKLFTNTPNAIPGNDISKCDTSSAAFQSETTGLVDGTGSEEDILADIRSLVCMLPCNNEEDSSYEECNDDLNRVCADLANAKEDTAIALTMISEDQSLEDEVLARKAHTVITPHPGEAARMLHRDVKSIQADRVTSARELSLQTGAITVLKGTGTVVTLRSSRSWINPTGNACLATAGSGDVLAGMIGSFFAQKFDLVSATLGAVWLHGEAVRARNTGIVAMDICDRAARALEILRWGGNPDDLVDPYDESEFILDEDGPGEAIARTMGSEEA